MDILSLSDEQISNMSVEDLNKLEETSSTDEKETTDVETVDESPEAEEPTSELASENQEEDTTEDDAEEVADEEQEKSGEDTTDYKAQLDLLFAPLTANGKTITIDNVADARRLIQMGLGFNKKMATLKPYLKYARMLENNGLLDESKLSFLIDISKKDPNAISKLLADSNIDPLNLNSTSDYTPNTYTVSDSEIELSNALDELKDSTHFGSLLDTVVNKWDDSSKQLLVSNPNIIRDLHSHKELGIYDKVVAVVEKERALGRLLGLSDLEAYKKVGDAMDAQGLFADTPVEKPKATPTVTAKVNAKDLSLKSRKLAASPTKTSPKKQVDLSNFNPLAMKDEEIANMTFEQYLAKSGVKL